MYVYIILVFIECIDQLQIFISFYGDDQACSGAEKVVDWDGLIICGQTLKEATLLKMKKISLLNSMHF